VCQKYYLQKSSIFQWLIEIGGFNGQGEKIQYCESFSVTWLYNKLMIDGSFCTLQCFMKILVENMNQ